MTRQENVPTPSGGGFVLRACIVGLMLCAALRAAGAARKPAPNHDPDAARLITADLEHFLRARSLADAAGSAAERELVYQHEYLDKGSAGLKDFLRLRIKSPQSLVHEIATRPHYYASLDRVVPRVAQMEPDIRKSFRKLKDLYADAVFPDVYFLIGVMNSGGTTSDSGLLIGLEMYAKTPETDMSEMDDWLKAVLKPADEMSGIVAHELIHFQQRPGGKTLLGQSIHEGAADFVGSMISGNDINAHVRAYGEAHEAQLWSEFSRVMDKEDVSGWLFQGNASRDRPADLGYYVGSRIAESYYGNAADKNQALRDILTATDYVALLRRSGYAGGLTGK